MSRREFKPEHTLGIHADIVPGDVSVLVETNARLDAVAEDAGTVGCYGRATGLGPDEGVDLTAPEEGLAGEGADGGASRSQRRRDDAAFKEVAPRCGHRNGVLGFGLTG